MKKLMLLVVLFIAQISFAQIINLGSKFYKAELTMSNGAVKEGYAEPVSVHKSSINFKPTKDGKKEIIELTKLEKVHYYDEKEGREAIAERLLANNGDYKSEAFLYLIELGEISLYSQTSAFYIITNKTMIRREADISYFFRYKDEKDVTLITMKFEGGIGIPIGLKKFTKKAIKDFFSDKCPKLVTAYENDEIKFKKDVSVFIDYYEKNCK
ncbi:hypothetical protein GCM10010992_13150 [Cloacibacterium rupense]|uniref:GLPGLI family protein n=1 Tax=Cloacibacterium rupense TaxID=517423 RepID=A0ABQ2NKS9_9FLAO|nr:hypothetical protein [Cloacibacterium rupense]GGP03714.1 hypothetical protein GCM10010992_13150 [Cloacibacterium rupense]